MKEEWKKPEVKELKVEYTLCHSGNTGSTGSGGWNWDGWNWGDRDWKDWWKNHRR